MRSGSYEGTDEEEEEEDDDDDDDTDRDRDREELDDIPYFNIDKSLASSLFISKYTTKILLLIFM